MVLVSLLVFLPAQTVASTSAPLLTTTLTTGTVVQTTFASNEAVSVSYTDTSTTPFVVLVWLSVQNSAGQTVATFASTLSLTGGGNGSVPVIMYGLSPGTYTGVVFAVTLAGVPISTASTVQVKL